MKTMLGVAAVVLVLVVAGKSLKTKETLIGPSAKEEAIALDLGNDRDMNLYVTLMTAETPFISVDLWGPEELVLEACTGSRPRITCFLKTKNLADLHGYRLTASAKREDRQYDIDKRGDDVNVPGGVVFAPEYLYGLSQVEILVPNTANHVTLKYRR